MDIQLRHRFRLLMEMRLERDGVRVCSIYTDQYTVYPEFDDALFRIPQTE